MPDDFKEEYARQLKSALEKLNERFFEPLGKAAEADIAAGRNVCLCCGEKTMLMHMAAGWVCEKMAQKAFAHFGGGVLDFTREESDEHST